MNTKKTPDENERLKNGTLPHDPFADAVPIAVALAAKNGTTPEAPASTTIRATDLGNARRFVRRHGTDLRYCPGLGWLAWDGRRWQRDETGEVERRARDVPRELFKEAADLETEALSLNGKEAQELRARAEEIRRHAVKTESEPSLRRLVELAWPSVPVRVEKLDRNPFLLTVLNGTVDLKTGVLVPHRREDLATKLAPVAFDLGARSELWESFLARVTGGKVELAAYLRRVAGYAFTGDVSEQCCFLLHGKGANGKSTFVEVLRAALGDFAIAAQFSTFMAKRNESSVRSDVARLRGARLVSAIESKEAGRLDEGLVKQLTGGDSVVAAFKYENEFEFSPSFKLVLAANERPAIRGTDLGIWRRVRLVPFTVTIPPEEQDLKLKEKLIATELPGVLAWAVQGCLEWQRSGLAEPEEVKLATEDYRQDEDEIAPFVAECCALDEPKAAKPAWTSTAELHEAYRAWAEARGEQHPRGERKFSCLLESRGLDRRRAHGGVRGFLGIRVTQRCVTPGKSLSARAHEGLSGKDATLRHQGGLGADWTEEPGEDFDH